MSTVARLLTYDDLCRMPDDGKRYEIIGGELIVSPSPNRAHQRCSYRLSRLIGEKVDSEHLGEVCYAPVDVRLSLHDVVQPDLLFIRQDRLDIYQARGDVQGPPDLAVEIISPSSQDIDPGRKFDLYARAGVREYWLVDPMKRTFQVFVLRERRYSEVASFEGRYHSSVINGLIIDPAVIFADLD